MRDLRLILSAAEPERLRAALMLAMARVALGAEAALFLHLDAVSLLAGPLAGERDQAHIAVGLPSLADIWEEALAAGVNVIACQSGLALAGLSAEALDSRITLSGLIGFEQQWNAAEMVAL